MAGGPKTGNRSSRKRRKNIIPIRVPPQTLFAEKELNFLRKFEAFNQRENVIEVLCGCTDKKYGDTVATLMIFLTGQFIINCNCPLDHTKENKETKTSESADPRRLTPKEFESHARSGVRSWKHNIWVMNMIEGKKVSLRKSGLLRYYKHAANESNWDRAKSTFIHRDEFIRCCLCGKDRRFRLRTADECKVCHDESKVLNWRCGYYYGGIDCNEEEERESRKSYLGCPRAKACKGCTSCVCLGCNMCRFKTCACRTCVDYIQNVDP